MNKVVDILMKRDGLDYEDATYKLYETRAFIYDAMYVGRFDKIEDIIAQELGLELDYIDDILYAPF